jgi:MATE family multidrug resistance protein
VSIAQDGFGRVSFDRASDYRGIVDEGRSLLRLATPIMLIALVNMGMSLTDTAMVASLFGTRALAAVAVGSDLYSIVFYMCAGVLGGLAPLYAGAFARGEARELVRLERLGWLTVGLLAMVAVPLVWLAPVWLGPLGIEKGLLEDGAGYVRAMALTLIPMLGVALYRTLLTAAELPRVFLKVTLAMLPLNAGANYVLMVGAGPLPAFGPTGAGVSSLVVATASLGLLAAITHRSARNKAAVVGASIDWSGLAAVLRIGVPIGIATVAEVGVFLGATLYAARTPSESLGWMKMTSVPCAPIRGSPSTLAPFFSISTLVACISFTSKQTWCCPPLGFFSRKFRMGDFSPSGSMISSCVLGRLMNPTRTHCAGMSNG